MDRTYHRSERQQSAHDPHRFRIQARIHALDHVNIGDTPIRVNQKTHDHLPLNVTFLSNYRVFHFSRYPVLYSPDSMQRNIQMIKALTRTRLMTIRLMGNHLPFHQIMKI